MPTTTDHPHQDLWAITSYFNPMGYRRRLANFHIFRERLCVPLVAVELAYHPEFELHADDADVLIQLHGRDVMWQKERLLNIALSHVPTSCRNVAYVDADIIFAEPEWATEACRLLDQYKLVQLFQEVCDLPYDALPETVSNIEPCSFKCFRRLPFSIRQATRRRPALYRSTEAKTQLLESGYWLGVSPGNL